MKTDAISIVEAAYVLEGDRRSWVERLLERIGPRLDRGFGAAASVFDPRSGVQELIGWRVDESFWSTTSAMMAPSNAELVRRAHVIPAPVVTMSQTFGVTGDEWLAHPMAMILPPKARDALGVTASDPEGRVFVLSAFMPETRRATKKELAQLGRIAAHVGAGLRLRANLTALSEPGDPADGAEAVLSPSGAVHHAQPAAQGTVARDALRAAAKAIDRARGKVRKREDEALDLWKGLVTGRWSLIDRFDSDGRRLLIARKNDPQVSNPRELTMRERQVLAYTALGHPLKLIAYELGSSTSSVAQQRANGMRKLGLKDHADVARVFAQAPKT